MNTLSTLLHTPHLRTQALLMRDLRAVYRTHWLYAASQAGMLAALRTPASQAQLTAALGVVRPELLDSMLDLGVALGELAREGDRYRLKGQRARALSDTDGDALAAFLEESVTYHESVYRLLAERLKGAPSGNYLESTGELIARSSRVLEPFIANFVTAVVKAYRPKSILEIGCGSGVYLRYAAQAAPNLNGTGLDMQPDVVEQAQRNLALWGLGERFQIILANVLIPPASITGPFDLATLYNNIYYFTPKQRAYLFEKVRGWLAPRGVLAIVTPVRGGSVEGINFDLVLRSTEGCTALPDLGELDGELRASGLTPVRQEQLVPGQIFYGIVGQAPT